MPITVVVCPGAGGRAELTFDGTQRVVIGRGAGCDVRLPDPSVSHRHAVLRSQGAEFVLVDEGSTNGTFVGGVRVAAQTSRVVRSGDQVRLGRVWLELRCEQKPATRDLGAATRELALAFVARWLDSKGEDRTPRVRVVEGPDRGRTLTLAEEDRDYVMGRAPTCDLPIADSGASREHAHVVRRGVAVWLQDLGAKNGTWLAGSRAPAQRPIAWRPTQMVRIGGTVLAIDEPVGDALGRLESVPDEVLADEPPAPPRHTPPSPSLPPSVVMGQAAGPPPPLLDATLVSPIPSSSPIVLPNVSADAAGINSMAMPAGASVAPAGRAGDAVKAPPGRESPSQGRRRWSTADLMVMAAAVSVLLLSLAGLVWLLRG